MSDLTNKRMDEKWDAFKKVLLKLGVPEKLWLPDELALATAWDELRDAHKEVVVEAYRSALAGETDDKVLWRAIEATYTDANCERIEKELDKQGAGPATVENHVEAAIRAAAPILRAPLLVQLQDKEERIKALEAFIAIPGVPMTTDLDFERAENETLCVPIEDIDKEISAEGSEARYRAFNANLQAQHRAIVAPLKARIAELEGVSCGYCRGLKRLNEEAP